MYFIFIEMINILNYNRETIKIYLITFFNINKYMKRLNNTTIESTAIVERKY
jgi:hypothetical protein